MLRKNFCKFLSLVLVILVLVLPMLVACKNGISDESGSSSKASDESESNSGEPGTGKWDYDDMLKIVVDNVCNFSIVRAENASTSVKNSFLKLGKAIKEKTTVEPEMITDFEKLYPVREYEIVVGNTTRNGSVFDYDTSSLGDLECIIKVIDTRIVILGGSDLAISKGVDYFIENALKLTDEGDFLLKKDYNCSLSANTDDLTRIKIMTQNLLATDDEYASLENYETTYSINVRLERVRKVIEQNHPDFVGLQECSAPWRSYFDSITSETGYKRIGASKNPKIGILYDTKKWKPIKEGSFWLSPKPDSQKTAPEWANGKEVNERLCMYVIFESLETGERLIHFNTHIGFDTDMLATNQTKVILDRIKLVTADSNYPVILTGDCNFNSDSSQYKLMTSVTLCDTKYTAAVSEGKGSFNKLKSDTHHSLPVDQIFVSRSSWIVDSYKVDYTKFNGLYASDHFAVVSELRLITKY